MAKRDRGSSSRVNKRREIEGRGSGRGTNYKPWLVIQDVPSIGLATRDKGWKTQRIHHFMSQLEWMYFYILEWSSTVIDIREQFPLDLEETMAIAKGLGVRHPMDRKTREYQVMTTDFLITIRKPIGSEDLARTLKYVKDLSSVRVMEKFEIERIYWSCRNIKWGIVTEIDIDQILVENVKWAHPFHDLETLFPITEDMVRSVATSLTPQVIAGEARLSDLTSACDNLLGMKSGASLTVVRHLIANRKWRVNMSKLIQPTQKINLIPS
jgi:TnsA endonuclease-like protein